MSDLKLQMLSKQFVRPEGRRINAVRSVSLEVADGELLAIVGPSASGKTTLLRLIAGLEMPDSGCIETDGINITRVPARNRNVAMVFQSLALYPHMTVAQNIDFGLRLRGTAKLERQRRTIELAQRLGISQCLERRPFELSGGQRQRAALARALIGQPDFLLLDEPLSHLDGPLRRQLCGELKALHAEFSLTTLMVTHDLAEAEALGHRLAVMNNGRIEQAASIRDLRASPATPFVEEFLRPGLI